MPCFHYIVQFKKDWKAKIHILIDFDSNVNAITLVYVKKLGLCIRKTNVGAPKIDGSNLTTYKIIIAGFQVVNKLGKACFF